MKGRMPALLWLSCAISAIDQGGWNPQGAGSLATMGRGLAAGQDPNPTAHTFAGQTAQDRLYPFQAEAMAIELVGPQTPQISAKSMLSPGNCWPASSC
jgi:hypothetical protein